MTIYHNFATELAYSTIMKAEKSGIMSILTNIDHSKNWLKMDTVIFDIGIPGLHLVQFLSFILYFVTDSDTLKLLI